MGSFNAVGAVVTALKTWPEAVSLPESLIDATPVQLAEARNRLQQISQVAAELRKTVDVLLASHLHGGALRYGESILRPNNGRGPAKVVHDPKFYEAVAVAVERSDAPETLLASLFPARSVKLSGLPDLAAALNVSADSLRETFIAHDPTTSPLVVMPLALAPKWAQKLEEGQFSGVKRDDGSAVV